MNEFRQQREDAKRPVIPDFGDGLLGTAALLLSFQGIWIFWKVELHFGT